MEEGVLPDTLKIAKVTHVFEAGEKDGLSKYRHISVLPSLSNMFERIIYKLPLWDEHLKDKKNLYSRNSQFYRPSHRTVSWPSS